MPIRQGEAIGPGQMTVRFWFSLQSWCIRVFPANLFLRCLYLLILLFFCALVVRHFAYFIAVFTCSRNSL